jgi:hypothetical protein
MNDLDSLTAVVNGEFRRRYQNWLRAAFGNVQKLAIEWFQEHGLRDN